MTATTEEQKRVILQDRKGNHNQLWRATRPPRAAMGVGRRVPNVRRTTPCHLETFVTMTRTNTGGRIQYTILPGRWLPIEPKNTVGFVPHVRKHSLALECAFKNDNAQPTREQENRL